MSTKFKYGMGEVCDLTNESRPVVDAASNAGHLETFVVGRRRFATPEAVKRWVDYLKRESDAGRPVAYRARAKIERAA